MKAQCALVHVFVLGVWFGYPAASHAQQTYESLIHEAVQEFDSANYVEARILFERAAQIKPGARTARALGYCDYELKHYVNAVTELQAALDDTRNPLTSDQRRDVSTTLEKARRFIGELSVETQPKAAELLLDGNSVSGHKWTLDAGDHVLAASATGYRSSELRVTISSGKETKAQLLLSRIEVSPAEVARSAEPAQSDSPIARGSDTPRDSDSGLLSQWWFWTAVGVVVVGATVGTLVAVNQPEKASTGSSGVLLHTR